MKRMELKRAPARTRGCRLFGGRSSSDEQPGDVVRAPSIMSAEARPPDAAAATQLFSPYRRQAATGAMSWSAGGTSSPTVLGRRGGVGTREASGGLLSAGGFRVTACGPGTSRVFRMIAPADARSPVGYDGVEIVPIAPVLVRGKEYRSLSNKRCTLRLVPP